jgi:hypothetical protein
MPNDLECPLCGGGLERRESEWLCLTCDVTFV